MLEFVRDWWPFSRSVAIGVGVISVLLLVIVGVFVAPSVVLPTTEEQDVENVRSLPLIVENGTEVSFSSDTRATITQEIRLDRDGEIGSIYFHTIVQYDSDSERVLIRDSPHITDDANPRYQDRRFVKQDYYARNNSTGEFERYTLNRVYNSTSDSWSNMEEYGDEDWCRINETAYVEKTGSGLEHDVRLPFSSGDLAIESGSMFTELSVQESENQKQITVEEGRYRPSVASGGFVHITESEGRVVASKEESQESGSVYEVREANLTATGQFYDGFLHFPVTKFWNGGQHFEINQDVSVNQSASVTVQEPDWVGKYNEVCGGE